MVREEGEHCCGESCNIGAVSAPPWPCTVDYSGAQVHRGPSDYDHVIAELPQKLRPAAGDSLD